MKVRYDGCTDVQANFGGSTDPRNFLKEGGVYELERREVHSWHTLYYLQGFSKPFNSVCFSEF